MRTEHRKTVSENDKVTIIHTVKDFLLCFKGTQYKYVSTCTSPQFRDL